MRTGRSLTEIASEVERQARSKKDFIATTDNLTMIGGVDLGIRKEGKYVNVSAVTDHTHTQIGTFTDIPSKFYQRLRTEDPEALDYNVNRILHRNPVRRMVRTLDGKARALVSDRYARRDNFELMKFILPELGGRGDLKFESLELTERKLYLKLSCPKIRGEVKVGDEVMSGIIVSNSEIGEGNTSAFPFLTTLRCLNGMTFTAYGQRRAHIGKRITEEEEMAEFYSEETLRADDEAFFLRLRDVVRAILTQETFDKLIGLLRRAADVKIEKSPESVVEVLGDKYQLNAAERSGVLQHLIQDNFGYTAYGLANAVTSVAGETADYDRASDLELLGSKLVELDPSQWKLISQAEREPVVVRR